MRQFFKYSATALVAGLLTWSYIAAPTSGVSPRAAPAPLAAAASAPVAPLTAKAGGVFDFADLVEQSEASVVQVRVEKKARPADATQNPFFDFLRKYGVPEGSGPSPFGAPPDASRSPYGNEDPDEEDSPGSGKSSGIGSGFFIEADGYLLTNAHVVDGADRVMLRLQDRREIPAKVVGLDTRTDVALLKAESGGPFKPLRIGDPEKARVGEWVVAIGSPFGFESTATSGILSAKGRSLPQDDNYLPFLQTDAAVNPGNSGGPLLSQRGEVIGINTQIYSRSGGYMGLSFSIPIDYAMRIAMKLKKNGSVSHGRMGAVIQEMTPELGRALGVQNGQGALVVQVEPGSPAAKAGLKVGDALVSVDGKRLDSSSAFVRSIADSEPGSKVLVGIIRKGQTLSIPMVIGSSPRKNTKVSDESARPPAPAFEEAFGLRLAPGKGDSKDETGLLVLGATGLAARAGIAKGDVLISADGEVLGSVAQLKKIASAGPKGTPMAVLVQRGKTAVFVALSR